MFWICNLQVPRTAITLTLAEMSSIILVVLGIISILCFFTNLASTQSCACIRQGPQCGQSFVVGFTLRLISGVGDPGTSAYAIGNDTEFLPFVVVLTDAAFAVNFNFCLFLLLT